MRGVVLAVCSCVLLVDLRVSRLVACLLVGLFVVYLVVSLVCDLE